MADVYVVSEDIVYNIFLRLPAKPLLRCKCLSKHWNRVISDTHFMKLRSRRMIFYRSNQDLYSIDIMAPGDDIAHSINILNPRGVIIGRTCNGIVLLVFKDMTLYNPFTRAFKIVPNPCVRLDNCWFDSFGIGYGTTPHDLKIVRLRESTEGKKNCCDSFSLKQGTWTTPTELIGDHLIYHSAGTFVNGFLYWTAKNIDRDTKLIVALNVKEMVFSEIQFPCLSPLDPLGTLHGRLCIFIINDDDKYGIWVMKEHDFCNSSWSKVYSLSSLLGPDYWSRQPYILDEEKLVIFKERNQLIIYDMLSKQVYKGNTCTTHGNGWKPQAIEYVESLMSPSDLCTV